MFKKCDKCGGEFPQSEGAETEVVIVFTTIIRGGAFDIQEVGNINAVLCVPCADEIGRQAEVILT